MKDNSKPRAVDPIQGSNESDSPQAVTDEEVVERVLAGDRALFEIIMRRYNQRLFRTLRAMVSSDSEAEDALQEAYVRAYQHLAQFEGRAKFSTWLTRIAIHEVLARQRRESRFTSLESLDSPPALSVDRPEPDQTPEEAASSTQLRGVLEHSIQQLPETLRLVFILREVDGLKTDETAECLEISEANVKVRLHRARTQLRSVIDRQLGAEVRRLHQFAGARCDSIVVRVLDRIIPNRKQNNEV